MIIYDQTLGYKTLVDAQKLSNTIENVQKPSNQMVNIQKKKSTIRILWLNIHKNTVLP